MNEQCLFKRGSLHCTQTASTPYGFCKAHKATVQAKAALKEYEERQIKEAESDSDGESSSASGSEDEVPHKETGARHREGSDTKIAHREPSDSEESSESDDSSGSSDSESSDDEPVKTKQTPQSKGHTHLSKTTSTREKIDPRPIEKPKSVAQRTETKPKITLRPNFWGRYEEKQTGLVFDPETKAAYGVQDPSGSVYRLTKKHIRICEQKGWAYICSDESDEESSSSED